jgi:hypothetical protein
MKRRSILILILGIALVTGLGLRSVGATTPPEAPQAYFNNDTYADLAIGAPDNLVRGLEAGTTSVMYGESYGLSFTNNELWHENNIHTGAITDDRFGDALAVGDFNGDGHTDLAIGVPGENVNGKDRAGEVWVLYGTADGLATYGYQILNQDVLGTEETEGANFGTSLAAGDFNGDNYDDLAVGVPYMDLLALDNVGAVHVIFGSPDGLTAEGDIFCYQPIAEWVEDDLFGYTLATGDFDEDGFDDLAVGVPYEDAGGAVNSGQVDVFYGDASGLPAQPDQSWYQGNGIQETPEASDYFGYALAVGDFDGNGNDDLAIGAYGENFETPYEYDVGVVHIIYGDWFGLDPDFDMLWDQDILDLESAEAGDQFGRSLAAGDFDGDGRDDLAIGAPNEDFDGAPSVDNAGVVSILYGYGSGIVDRPGQNWHQSYSAILNDPEKDDRFGWTLAAGDFNGDGYADLAVGVPYEDSDSTGDVDSGIVHVLFGNSVGLVISGNQIWDQADITDGEIYKNAEFGFALAALPRNERKVFLPLIPKNTE